MLNRATLQELAAQEQFAITAESKSRRIALAVSITGLTQWVMAGLAGFVLIAWLGLRDYPQVLIFAVALAVAGAASWLFRRLAAQERAGLGGALCLGWFMALTAACPVLWPEIIAAAGMCYLFVIMMSYIIFGTRGLITAVAASLVLFLLDMLYIYNPQAHWFPDLPYTLGPLLGGLNGGLAILVLSGFCYQIFTSQERAFAEAQRASREVERRVSQEKARQRLVQQTVRDYVDVMTIVGQGNLAARIPIDARAGAAEDPLVALGVELNQTFANLEAIMEQIRQAAGNLGSAAAEILAAMTQQAAGTSEQSVAITQTTTTVQEVSSIAAHAVERAQEVVTSSRQAAEVSRSGQQAVQETLDGMAQIKEQVEGISLNILALSEKTQQIGAIIASVNELAAQSNMLALNAAVEAARAGEAGRGFAVVAAEVRALAEQSRRATAQVKAILQEIQQATNTSVVSTEEGLKVVERGVSLSRRTQATIQQLVGMINESVERMMQVMTGGQQQAAGIEQVTAAMVSIQAVSAQSLASTRQSELAAQNLNGLAASLNQTLARYTRNGAAAGPAARIDFARARLVHRNWIKRLADFMDGRAPLNDDALVSHQDCELGRWIYATALDQFGSLAEIRELERVHAEFHQGVRQVVQLKQAGQVGKAEDEMAAVQGMTERIFNLLSFAEEEVARG